MNEDKRIYDLKTKIKQNKEFLLQNKKELETGATNNKYLEGVVKNYKKYYDNVSEEKQRQYDAMMLLKEYLDDLINEDKITNNQLRDAKRQQRNIVMEMEKITNELKKII